MGEQERGKDKDKERDAKSENSKFLPDYYDTSASASMHSHSKGEGNRRPSLTFLNATPSSPQPEALPCYPMAQFSPSNESQSSLGRTPSMKRPETVKSMKSDKSLTSRTGSVKKRLSFMNISKKSSKSSVRGRMDDTLVEE